MPGFPNCVVAALKPLFKPKPAASTAINFTASSSWFDLFGAERFLLGADVKNEKLAIHGWTETTTIDIIPFIKKFMEYGVQQVFCTDVSKDGKLEGPSLDLYKKIITQFPGLYFIASGGISNITDLDELKYAGCKGAIIGKAIYEGRITADELFNWQTAHTAG